MVSTVCLRKHNCTGLVLVSALGCLPPVPFYSTSMGRYRVVRSRTLNTTPCSLGLRTITRSHIHSIGVEEYQARGVHRRRRRRVGRPSPSRGKTQRERERGRKRTERSESRKDACLARPLAQEDAVLDLRGVTFRPPLHRPNNRGETEGEREGALHHCGPQAQAGTAHAPSPPPAARREKQQAVVGRRNRAVHEGGGKHRERHIPVGTNSNTFLNSNIYD